MVNVVGLGIGLVMAIVGVVAILYYWKTKSSQQQPQVGLFPKFSHLMFLLGGIMFILISVAVLIGSLLSS